MAAARTAASAPAPLWHRRLLGPDLVQCSSAADVEMKTVPTDSVLCPSDSTLEFVGLFFTPVLGTDEDNLLEKLAALYKRVNGESATAKEAAAAAAGRRLEVVQVVAPGGSDCAGSADGEEAFRSCVKNAPWFALPHRDARRQARLWRRFRARAAAPSLVLLEARSGRVVTSGGAGSLAADPAGARFPWRPRPALAALAPAAAPEGALVRARDLRPAPPPDAAHVDVIGLYFSANWCPPCKAFTPQLVQLYERLRQRGQRFEVVFVSCDRSEQSFEAYARHMPWLALPWAAAERRAELAALFSVAGIPALVLLHAAAGRLLALDGRALVADDPFGRDFPWYPKLVNILTERFASKIQDHPAVILFVENDQGEVAFAESVLLPAAEEYRLRYEPAEDEDYLLFLVGCDNDSSDLLREFIGVDDVVPLLTVVDIPSGRVSIMEDGEEITEASVKTFVTKFLNGTLPTTDIVLPDVQINLRSMSML